MEVVFKNISWLLLERLIRLFISSISIIIVARYLGPDGLGVFNTALSIVALFAAIAGFGLRMPMMDMYLKKAFPKNVIYTNGSLILIVTSIFTWFLGVLFTSFLFIGEKQLLLTVCIMSTSLFFKYFETSLFYFEAKLLPKPMVLARTISLIVGLILKIVIIYLDLGLMYLSGAVALEGIFMYALYHIHSHRMSLLIQKKNFDWQTVKLLIRRSSSLLVTSLGAIALLRTDQIMIARFLSFEDAGFYSAATRVTESLFILSPIIVSSFYPKLAAAFSETLASFYQHLKRTLIILSCANIVCSVILFAFAEPIIEILYGDQFFYAKEILELHSFILLINGLLILRSSIFVITNLEKVDAKIMMIMVFLNVPINYFFLDRWGAIGAVYATITLIVLSLTVFPYFVKRGDIFVSLCKRALINGLQNNS